MGTNKRETAFADVGIDWDSECEVRVRKNGHMSAMKRMIPVKGKITLDATLLLDAVEEWMRKGYDVRLTRNSEEAVRFYPFASSDCKSLLVRVQPLGKAADWLKDKKIAVRHRGEMKSGEEVKSMVSEQRRKGREYVTPDTVVTCPECGFEFRVGRPNGEE